MKKVILPILIVFAVISGGYFVASKAGVCLCNPCHCNPCNCK